MTRSVLDRRRLPVSAVRRRGTGRWSVPVSRSANALSRRARTKHVNAFVPVSSVVAVSTGLPGRSPYEVIPNFIPDDLVLDEAAPRPDGPIVFVGDLSRDKGIEVLLEAHKRLGGRPRLVLAGRAVEGMPLEFSDQVELRGLLDHAAVMDLMQTASVVVAPSIVPDCCPTVVLEAMAVGRPVVAAASGGIVDLVDDGVTGLLVAAGDPVALSAALSKVVNDPEIAAAMGRAALERVRSFTASAVVGRVESLYERLMSGLPPEN